MTKSNVKKSNNGISLKSIFSSLTCRRARYEYVLIGNKEIKDTIILSNSDIDILTSYNNNKLCFHIVTFKSLEAKNIYEKEYLQINDFDGCLEKNASLYCRHPVEYLSFLKKKETTPLTIKTDKFYNMTSSSFYDPKKEKDVVIELGNIVDNYYATIIIEHLYASYGKQNIYEDKPHQIINIDINTLLQSTNSAIYTYKLNIHNFINKDTTRNNLFDNYQEYITLFLFDGIDVVSLREYVKKLKISYTLQLIAWVENEYIKYMMYFEDDHISVKTFRPHIYIFPLLNLTKILGEQ